MADDARPFDRDAVLPMVQAAFGTMVPFNGALGLSVVDCARGVMVLKLPWREDLVGNPLTGVLHGGAITALLDACGGASVFLAMSRPVPIATLDLRIDYLKPASPHRDVIARAECYKLTKSVAFVRALAYHDDENDPIAAVAATFMISTRGDSVMKAAR